MGLDSGIVVRITEETPRKQIKRIKALDKNVKLIDEAEVCYWRKCWNVRNVVKRITGKNFQDGGNTLLTASDVFEIRQWLKKQNKKKWNFDEGSCESIWSWDEIKPHIKFQIKNLTRLLKIMEEDEENAIVVYFYDSY